MTSLEERIQALENRVLALEGKKIARKFVPPTLEEVKMYIKDNRLVVDGEQFFRYFTEGGWVDSKGQRVRSWKQKLLTWDGHKGNRQRDEDAAREEKLRKAMSYE